MGQVLRDAKDASTLIGVEAAKYAEEGKLVPSELVQALTRFRLEQKDCQKGFVLDGAPRRVEEAVVFEDYLSRKGTKIDYVFLIEVPDQEVINRLLKRHLLPKEQGGGREDDNEHDIKVRLLEYRQHTDEVVLYFKQKGLLKNIDGRGSKKQVYDRLAAILQL
jgi:adenylate kinase